ncbi:MAG TPA: tetratricopeptide repeat protein [Thermoanaerobaculaceae bacterium]|nr:tetratricopeptide repeat protein [Thermoanaerobaculaceae bacterium]
MNALTTTASALLIALATTPRMASAQAAPATPAAPGAAAPAPRVEVERRSGLPGRDVALLISGQQGGQIAVSAEIFPPGSAGKPERVPWVIDVPGPTLALMTDDGRLDLEVSAYALRGESEIVGNELDTVHVTGAPASWQADGGLKLMGYVDATALPSRLRFLLREPVTGAFGNWEIPMPGMAGPTSRSVDFGMAVVTDVGSRPSAGGGNDSGGGMVGTGFEGMTGSSAVLALVIPDRPEAWLVAGLGGASSDASSAPFSIVGKGGVPSTRAVLRPGANLHVMLIGQSLPGMLEAHARVVRGDGRPDEGCPARYINRMPAPGGPFERVDVAVTLPADLPAGEHGLVVTLRPAGGLDAGSMSAPFRVAPPDKVAVALAWPSVPVDAAGRLTDLPKRDAAVTTAEEEVPAHLKSAYREAVGRFAADPSPESLRALVQFERAALGTGTSGELSHLAAVERSLAHDVGKRSPQALLGLCQIHLDLYREHSRDQALLAIGHSRRIVEEMAEVLAADAKDMERKRDAADVLTVFAASLQAVGSYGSAERLYARAATLDAGDVAALMGRAGILERAGDAKHAVEILDKVLAIKPDHAEAELRRGVNLFRSNRDAAARKALTTCTTADRPAWVRAVAWQELAANLLAADEVDQAVRVLHEATAALPADPNLQVLLASALDRERKHRDAQTVANAVVEHPAGDTPSARAIYGAWPHEDLDATRKRLTEARGETMAALAVADKAVGQ